MDRTTRFAGLLLFVATVAACGGNPEPDQSPDARADSIAQARQDSIARADSIRAAREAEEERRREEEATRLCERAQAAVTSENYDNARSLYERARDEFSGTDCAERADAALDRIDAIETVRERVHFEFDQSEITDEAAQVLQRKAEVLRDNPDMEITIAGHADERGSNEYNMALGQRRAESARDYLVDLGVSEDQFDTTSYGEERPLVDRSTEEAWDQNRRAEFNIESMGDL